MLPAVIKEAAQTTIKVYFGFGSSIVWDACWEDGIIIIIIDPGTGRRFPYWVISGQTGIPWEPGWKYQQQHVVFVGGQFPVLGSYKHTAIRQTCRHSHWFRLCLLADLHSAFLLGYLFISQLFPLSLSLYFNNATHHLCLPSHITAVAPHPGQSDRVGRFDASVWFGLSKGEGQGGVGEAAGGGTSAGPQTHRDGNVNQNLA